MCFLMVPCAYLVALEKKTKTPPCGGGLRLVCNRSKPLVLLLVGRSTVGYQVWPLNPVTCLRGHGRRSKVRRCQLMRELTRAGPGVVVWRGCPAHTRYEVSCPCVICVRLCVYCGRGGQFLRQWELRLGMLHCGRGLVPPFRSAECTVIIRLSLDLGIEMGVGVVSSMWHAPSLVLP